MTSRIADLMQKVPAAAPFSGPAHAHAPAETGTYTTSAGKTVRPADMNPYHRENAIKKARREGNAELAALLEASRPQED